FEENLMSSSKEFDIRIESIFGTYEGEPPKYTGITTRSHYLLMRDGIKIAIDVILPAGIPQDVKIPALRMQTRYWRASQLREVFKWIMKRFRLTPVDDDPRHFFGKRGYALVYVDVRGTGASFGSLKHPWSQESVEDAREIVDWIIAQPWSNEKVGAFGTSYPGTTAEFLATLCHPAVKVVIPKFNHPDAYTDIAFPGGLFNKRFINYWGYFDKTLDNNLMPAEFGWLAKLMTKGVKPVDGDEDRVELQKAIREHAANKDVYETAKELTFRDEPNKESDIRVDDMVLHHLIDRVRETPTIIHGWESWMDAGTGDAVIRRFNTFDNARRAVIGAWDHGGRRHGSPYLAEEVPVSPSYHAQLGEMLRIFDAYLKDINNGICSEKALYYYTMGEEKWKVTPVWPPRGMQMHRCYLGENSKFSTVEPGSETGYDEYSVNFEVSSGKYNRWWEMGIFDKKSVVYPDRAEMDKLSLTYTSSPLEVDLEITGHPVVTLYTRSSEPDTAYYIYLEDVSSDGRVTYITEGLLRSIHRKISAEPSPYELQIPYHTYKKDDAMPLVPGETAGLRFGLYPTSVLVRKGHCIRISIAGHDKGTFSRVPAEGTPVITIERNRLFPSHIDLPVVPRSPAGNTVLGI
ncbi:MAG: CocE/NonD family hydrolase, partial [Anaerolineaceae bacterium]|nr:CocE/NonD family hydrolase [Anaerolineaceae bacterium]